MTQTLLAGTLDPFRFMADHASDAFFLVDDDGRIAYANRVAHAQRGYADGELIGLPTLAVNPNYDAARLRELFDAARGGTAFRLGHSHRRKDGSTFPVESSVNYLELDGRPYLFSAVRDVTERRREEEQLRLERERMAMVVQQSDVGVWFAPLPIGEFTWDAKVKEHFFLAPDAAANAEVFYARMHPDDRAPTAAAIARSVQTGEPYDVIYRTVAPDGSATRSIHAYGRIHHDDRGVPTMLDGVTIDVTRQARAAAAVRESEARFRDMANGAPVVIWVTRPDGYCTFLNHRWYELTGQTEAEALGIGWTHATHPDDVARAAATFLAANAARGPFYIEYRLRARDGTYRWCIDSAEPRFADDGTYLGYIGSVVDITERRLAEERLRESEQRLQSAVAIAQLGTFQIDLLTDAVEANPAGRAIYGWREDEVLTFAHVQTFFHPDDRDRVVRTVGAALAPGGSGRFEVEQRIVRRDGLTRWIRVRGTAVVDESTGRATRCIGTYLDVTDQVEEAARREALLDAERAARAEAERAGRVKDEFLTTLSHELRTPLNAILGWAHLLRRGDKSGDPSVAQGLDVIQRNARAQAQLIEDLLDMRQLVAGTIRLGERRPLDLAAVMRDAAQTVRPAAEAKQIALDLPAEESDAIVNGDPERLRQVVWNLLNNAVKFTPAGGRVRATLSRVGESVEARIADTGQGIAAEFLPHVFDRFTMADASTTRRHGGLGLGLAIAKALVELHGGAVAAESAGAGKGATFIVRLPLA